MERKLNKSQRRAFARICYFAFFTLSNVFTGVKRDQWFLDSLTEDEVNELEKLKQSTKKLAEKWRLFAAKLEGR